MRINSVCWSDKVEGGVLFMGVVVVALFTRWEGGGEQKDRMVRVKFA